MKKQVLVALAVVAIILPLFVFASIVGPIRTGESANISTDTFLQNRARLFTTLREQLLAPVEGVTIKLPPPRMPAENAFQLFPDEDHIRHVVRREEWNGGHNFQLLLKLDQSALPPDKQLNSQTMAATLLLEHYFGVLRRLGYRSQGSPNVMSGNRVQSASNVWFKDSDSSMRVEGTVFIANDSREAIVVCNVRERLPVQ